MVLVINKLFLIIEGKVFIGILIKFVFWIIKIWWIVFEFFWILWILLDFLDNICVWDIIFLVLIIFLFLINNRVFVLFWVVFVIIFCWMIKDFRIINCKCIIFFFFRFGNNLILVVNWGVFFLIFNINWVCSNFIFFIDLIFFLFLKGICCIVCNLIEELIDFWEGILGLFGIWNLVIGCNNKLGFFGVFIYLMYFNLDVINFGIIFFFGVVIWLFIRVKFFKFIL